MGKVIKLKGKVRPLRKTYHPTAPYVVERNDQDDGSITYDIIDERPESYRFVCSISEHDNDIAKHDAEQIARGLNLLVQYDKEDLPPIRDEDD